MWAKALLPDEVEADVSPAVCVLEVSAAHLERAAGQCVVRGS